MRASAIRPAVFRAAGGGRALGKPARLLRKVDAAGFLLSDFAVARAKSLDGADFLDGAMRCADLPGETTREMSARNSE
jgi:hypothetical protein